LCANTAPFYIRDLNLVPKGALNHPSQKPRMTGSCFINLAVGLWRKSMKVSFTNKPMFKVCPITIVGRGWIERNK
jgi:hypothetical protein